MIYCPLFDIVVALVVADLGVANTVVVVLVVTAFVVY